MESLIANSTLRKELGEKGYHAYQKNWTEGSYLEKYFNLINEIAKKKGISFKQQAV